MANSLKLLMLLNDNKVSEVKDILQKEVYESVLYSADGASKRYAAMKRFYKFISKQETHSSGITEFEYRQYTILVSGPAFVMTTESSGELDIHEGDEELFSKLKALLKVDGKSRIIDFTDVFAELTLKGYQTTTTFDTAAGGNFFLKIGKSYYSANLLDLVYSVLRNGRPMEVYKTRGKKPFLIIRNNIGIACIARVSGIKKAITKDKKIIEVEWKEV